MIIAIDGHSSCGKSSFAKRIADELDILYIDSGAMYRAATLYCFENDIIHAAKLNVDVLIQSLDKIQIEFRKIECSTKPQVFLNGKNVEDKIRSIQLSSMVSEVSVVAELRKRMVDIQRSFGKNQSVVMEGRDIGSVVFPDADIKIFLTASPEVRAKRRFDELTAKGEKVSLEEIMKNLTHRDKIDQSRETSPLIQSEDAILLDNSFMTPDEQMVWFRNLIKT
ncbi:MAG: (d)CMP kinase [Bacteroidales bacterium]|nr:(d)CMP kinase [Bacteroidales bacterium]MCF8391136.1 (d)CMP kinase [Bacteroidales bacterium]